jgi:hypothetical protein
LADRTREPVHDSPLLHVTKLCTHADPFQPQGFCGPKSGIVAEPKLVEGLGAAEVVGEAAPSFAGAWSRVASDVAHPVSAMATQTRMITRLRFIRPPRRRERQ